MATASDTSAEAARVQAEIFRAMSGEQRLLCAFEMSDLVVTIAEEGIRLRRPDYREDQVRLALLRLRLGDDLFKQVYPDAPLLAS